MITSTVAPFDKFLQVKNLKVKKIVFRFGAKLSLYYGLTKSFLPKCKKHVVKHINLPPISTILTHFRLKLHS